MAISEYNYIAALGQTCATNFRLARAAALYRLDSARRQGPFDWPANDLRQLIAIIEDDFSRFFRHDTIRVADAPDADNAWRVTEHHGVVAAHQMRREESENAPTIEQWFEFGKWLGTRLQAWHHHLMDRGGKILVVRNEEPAKPDRVEDLARLTELLKARVKGNFTFAWVRFEPPLTDFVHPRVRMHQVGRTWPRDLPTPPARR